ncbi:MAG: L,D-transpeptidase family protein [Oscillospiraceae bacterium]
MSTQEISMQSVQIKPQGTKKKRNRFKLFLLFLLMFILFACGTFYGVGYYYMRDKFLPNTFINSANFGLVTKEKAVDFLYDSLSDDYKKVYTIKKADGTDFKIAYKDICSHLDFEKMIDNCYDEQNHWLWFVNLFQKDDYSIDTTLTIDYDAIETQTENNLFENEGSETPQNAYIKQENNKYVVVPEVNSTTVSEDKKDYVLNYVKDEIIAGNTDIDVSELDCYNKAAITKDDLTVVCEELNQLKNREITIDFGFKQEKIKGSEMQSWIVLGKKDSAEPYTVDKSKVEEYVKNLNGRYNTYGKNRKFKTANNKTITVPQGNGLYGRYLDNGKTTEAIISAVKSGNSTTVTPAYKTVGGYCYTNNEDWQNSSDIGNTYIEIDLAKQTLWYFENGKKVLTAGIVSGLAGKSETPVGVYSVIEKEQNQLLQGTLSDGKPWQEYVNYEFVLNFNGINISDSSKQKKFGGTVYKKSGTQGGYVSISQKDSKTLFDKVQKGTPCVIYK